MEEGRTLFLSHVVRDEETMIFLLDDKLVMRFPEIDLSRLSDEETMALESETEEPLELEAGPRQFCPEATEAERALFLERARRLLHRDEAWEAEAKEPLVVVMLGGVYLGIELHALHGFAHLGRVTPVPCSPPHIAGEINLRGEILPLVDIRGLLQLDKNSKKPLSGLSGLSNHTCGEPPTPPTVKAKKCDFHGKIVLARAEGFSVGVPVEEIEDLLWLHADDVVKPDHADDSVCRKYLRGVVPYRGDMLHIVNLEYLLTDTALIVNEEV